MKRRVLKVGWIILLVATIFSIIVILSVLEMFPVNHKLLSSNTGFQAVQYANSPNMAIKGEKWILVDGTDIRDEHLRIHTKDVPGWRILVYGKHIMISSDRCSNCISINEILVQSSNSQFPPTTNEKMMSYLYAINHGAQKIYVTNRIVNLREQLGGFQTEGRVKGLLYSGRVIFDPDRHFGIKDIAVNRTARNQQSSYLFGEYVSPSVQTRWRPSKKSPKVQTIVIHDVACRLPHVIVPPRSFQSTDLIGSLVDYRSFWALVSLMSDAKSPSFAYWWLWLMRNVNETIAVYPPSCNDVSLSPSEEGIRVNQTIKNTLEEWTCESESSFFACGILLAQRMASHGLLIQSDVHLIERWFNMLILLNFKEPKRVKSQNNFSAGEVHKVIFEPMSKTHNEHEAPENPFKRICKSKLQGTNISQSAPPFRDILLIMIFNYPTHYSNILYYDYIYHTFFTNIIYCGRSLDKFNIFYGEYHRSVSFIELGESELNRGIFGYMCAAIAMEMGFRVSGYLQMSDDVLLNTQNIVNIPRDKLWFQSSIRNGSLAQPKVPNVAVNVEPKHWWIWSYKDWGIGSLNKTLSDLTDLMKTPEKSRVVSFFKQLDDNFGNTAGRGAFYEASDIFYVPDKYKNNFSFISKLCSKHHVHLEICIPTMFCGFDHINNIVRLSGNYLYMKEKKHCAQRFNPNHIFLHPCKLQEMLPKQQSFLCENYLPYVEGKKVDYTTVQN